jgi:PKD domain
MAMAVFGASLLTVTTFSARASASPARAVLSEAVPAAGATTSTAPLAQLLVATLGVRAGQVVTFDLTGSKIAAHRTLHSVVLAFGDGSDLRLTRISGTAHHTYRKVGVYPATLTIVDSAGQKSSARRVVVVGGTANQLQLKSTTVRLGASAIASIVPLGPTSESFTLAHGVAKPKVGQVLLVGRGKLVPDGLIAVVRTVTASSSKVITVTATDGTLNDAYAKLAAVAIGTVGATVQIVGQSARSAPSTSLGTTVPASAVPFTCSLAPDRPIQLTADFSNTHISADIDLSARLFAFDALVKPVFSVGVQFSGTAKCELSDGFGLNIPVPAIPGLVVTVAPLFTLSANGEIDLTATWDPTFFFGVVRSPIAADNTKDLVYKSSASAGASGSATLSIEGGLSVIVSAGKAAGLELDAGPELTAKLSAGSGQTCLDVSSDVAVQVQLFAHILTFIDATATLYDGHFDNSSLFSKCTSGSAGSSGSGSAAPPQSGGSSGGSSGSGQPYLGPTVTETTGSTARTWTDYVHAGGTPGPTLAANQSVGIACRTVGFKVADGNTWWYLVGSSPWNAAYYVSADAFYNNGATSGTLRGTPFVDASVPECTNMAGASPTPVTPPASPPSGSGKTYAETVGGVTHTWTNYSNAGGTQGPSIASNATVQVACKVAGFKVADGNTWWYQIASGPWNDAYYASADAFYNNGQTSGSLNGTPFVDGNVPDCAGPPSPPPTATTVAETTGSVTHTWTNYTNAGGSEGPSIASSTTVQIACRLTGFTVADGNTWWYRIASSPWSNSYYASADAFYNNGATSGSLHGTPFVDPNVPLC